MSLPVHPPVEPMLARLSDELPEGGDWQFEPKWDGFRALVFRDGRNVELQSREGRPLGRYFPELLDACRDQLPERLVLDGEIVIAGPHGLDFEALQLRLHPAQSRIERLSRETPASFVAFDLLALGDEDLRPWPQARRFERLALALRDVGPPLHLTPATRDRALAADWFTRFEGAGLDGVIAKRRADPYVSGERVMIKVKHARTADCVVGGFRWHKSGPGRLVGSLLLGLYDPHGVLWHVGVASSFSTEKRAALARELAPLRAHAQGGHPWAEWADASRNGMPGASSRWSAGKDLSWEPLRIERTCEVKYDHLQGRRFRHATTFVRWRPDKPPRACRFDQLEVAAPYELDEIFRPSAP
jgi:ATP-dependent DNA ligase